MHTFGKQEHLCNIAEIKDLFLRGHSIFKHPVKLIWLKGDWESPPDIKVVISVPKKNFKRAVDRNRLKRLLRESYRLNKQIIEDHLNNRKCFLGLVYSGKEICNFDTLEPIIIALFQRLMKDYEKITD